jgi:hypothetical protein
LQVGAKSSIKGLELKAPDSILKLMQMQALVANSPRIGVDQNVCYPAMQLNIASAVSEKPQSGNYYHSILALQLID